MVTETPPRGPIPARFEGRPRLAWHAASPEEVTEYWQAPAEGLTEAAAHERLTLLGPNRLAEAPRPPWWRRFFGQISDFTVLALLAAAVLAGLLAWFAPEPGQSFLERFGDSLAILTIVILNAVLGMVQEARAERALEALQEMTAPTARVIRDGRIVDVPAAQLVPGDVVLIESGDRVAADVRLFETHDLEVEEGALTGESLPVAKEAAASLTSETPLAERRTMAFMGTRVSRGRGRGMVTNTGMHSELGSIAGMLASVEAEQTPLEQNLEAFGKRVVLGCVVISAVVFAAGLFIARQSPRELFLVAVALAVAAIPEGLPAVTTIVLALGTTRMAQRNALVRRLPAVETLGCAQVICTDKTGTLTQNAMSVRQLWIGGRHFQVEGGPRSPIGGIISDGPIDASADLALALRSAVHAVGAKLTLRSDSNELEALGDPTDAALLTMAWKGGFRAHSEIIAERPFTSERRMASALVKGDGHRRVYVRGAPEALIAACAWIRRGGQEMPLTAAERQSVTEEALAWAGRALRVVALGYRDVQPDEELGGDIESQLTFVALVGISDPPRPEVKEAITEARRAGIKTIMITGDHPATGRAIAEEIGLWEEGDILVSGSELDQMDQQRLEEEVDHVRVVARATAAHKLRVVEALKARGFICAMTGDGVNDAPAVKSANIGVAMGRAGTDVTKEAASLVLADDNYATIVAAVEEGRAIFANIHKFIFFLLSSNAGAVLLVLGASLLGWDQPLAPIQILWINLITNGLPALALGVDPREPSQMREPPRRPGGAIISNLEYLEMIGVGVVMALSAGVAFYHFRSSGDPDALVRARTVCFAILAIGPLFHSFNCRSKTKSIFKLGLFSNRALWGAVAIGLILESLAIYVPVMHSVFRTGTPTHEELLWIAAMSVLPLVVGEIVKLLGGPPSAKAPAKTST